MRIILPIKIALLGFAGGIFVNYISDVLPQTRTLSKPICMNCGHPQSWANYILWPRLCPSCGKRRRLRIWAVDAIAIIIALWLWYSPPEILGFWVGFVLLVYFGSLVIMDLEHRVILHPVSIFGAVLGLGIGIWLHGFWDTIFGGAGGFGIMLFLYFFGGIFAQRLARRRNEELEEIALGFGDVNLAGVIGLMLGWPGILAGIFLGVFSAGVFSFFIISGMIVAKRYKPFSVIPYGPFLVLGAVMLLYFKGIFLP
ncbi:MAG: prepilin peptidase [Chloroflexi bacterium]|nr:prepilin peptidase [Chloroflexota bacterium]